MQMMNKTLKIDYVSEASENTHLSFQITRLPHKKFDLGGFRDPFANTFFLNAYSQTDQTQLTYAPRFDRDIQIFDLDTKSANPLREFGTQTPNPHLSIDDRTVNTLTPQRYFSSELWLRRRIEATMFIQKIVRGFLARKRVANIRRIRSEIKCERTLLTDARRQRLEAAHMREIQKRAHPRVSSQGKIRFSKSLQRT